MRNYNKGTNFQLWKTFLISVIALLIFAGECTTATSMDGENTGSAGLLITEDTREHCTVGTTFEIRGTITNNTKSIIYLKKEYATLKVPPEIDMPGATAGSEWYAIFPNANNVQTIPLMPGHLIPVYWQFNSNPFKPTNNSQPFTLMGAFTNVYQQFAFELNYLLFSPGKYKLTITVDYWNNANLTGIPEIATVSKLVDVAAPEPVILFGAVIGGLIAFVILPKTRRGLKMPPPSVHPAIRYFLYGAKVAIGLLGAMLLSAIVTILLASISESQFLVRVTANDVWGAIAIGFIANYLGTEVLNQIIKPIKPTNKDEDPSHQDNNT